MRNEATARYALERAEVYARGVMEKIELELQKVTLDKGFARKRTLDLSCCTVGLRRHPTESAMYLEM